MIQTREMHNKHHQGERNTNYCVMSNFLNPLLDKAQFWRRLEALIFIITLKEPRDEDQYQHLVRDMRAAMQS